MYWLANTATNIHLLCNIQCILFFCFIIFVLDTEIWMCTLNALRGGGCFTAMFFCVISLIGFHWMHCFGSRKFTCILDTAVQAHCAVHWVIFSKVYFYCNPFFALNIGWGRCVLGNAQCTSIIIRRSIRRDLSDTCNITGNPSINIKATWKLVPGTWGGVTNRELQKIISKKVSNTPEKLSKIEFQMRLF